MSKIAVIVTPWSDDRMKKYQWLDDCLQSQPSTVINKTIRIIDHGETTGALSAVKTKYQCHY